MSSYTEGQVHQLANALEGKGFTPDDVTKLGQYRDLRAIRGVLCGTHEIKPIAHIIDCDTAPFVPDGWRVKEHHKGGQFVWSLDAVGLFITPEQKSGRISGTELQKKLQDKPVLNANILDYLLAHPELIPEEWKGKCVFFWGTIYHNSSDGLYIRYLWWDGRRWHWHCSWLVNDFHFHSPALVRAS